MPTSPVKFDLIILGGGPGGVAAARAAVSRGMKVALINDGYLMGHSLEGAFKSKALYEISRVHFAMNRLSRQEQQGPFDFLGSYLAAQSGADGLRALEEKKLIDTGVTYIQGRGQLVSSHSVGVGNQVLTAANVIIATGTSPRILEGIRPSKQQILTFDDIVNVSRPLRSLVILGAGVIGCEFASIFAALGTTVTLLESKPQLFSHDDSDLSRLLTHALEDLGVKVRCGARCQSMEAKESGVITQLGGGETIFSDAALVAVGRIANTEGLHLHVAGVTHVDQRGFIQTTDTMQTNVPHIYAIGDVSKRKSKSVLRLVRMAELEGQVAISHMCGETPKIMANAIPHTIFTHPTVAGVGISEEHAERLFGEIRVGKWPHIRNHRSHLMPTQKGFVKLIVGPIDDDRIFGARAIGEGAESIISEVALMIQYRLPFTHLLDTPRAYPSFSESLQGAARIIAKLEPPHEEGEEYAYEFTGF